MNNSVLIVSEAFSLGGLETHIREYTQTMIEMNIEVSLAVGTNYLDDFIPNGLETFIPNLKCHRDMSFDDLVSDVNVLRELIRNKNITCVHAHPFISIIPAYIAAKLEKVSFVITMHGPMSIYASYPTLYDFLLKTIILPNTDQVFCVSDEVASLVKPYVDQDKITIQYNALNMSKNTEIEFNLDASTGWLLCSRLDPDKIEGIKSFVLYASESGIPKITIAGIGTSQKELELFFKENSLTEYVDFYGKCQNIPALMQNYNGVAGMGRVVLEAFSNKKPVVLVGYDGVKGIVTEDSFLSLIRSNFSGRNIPTISLNTFKESIASLDDKIVNEGVLRLLDLHCNIKNQVVHYRNILNNRKFFKTCLLCESYESYGYAVDKNTIESFFLSENFLYHLGEVLNGSQMYAARIESAFNYYLKKIIRTKEKVQLLCHNDLQEQSNDIIKNNNIVITETFANINDFHQTNDNHLDIEDIEMNDKEKTILDLEFQLKQSQLELKNLQEDILAIKSSTSWTLTKPVRVVGNIFKYPKATIFKIARFIYQNSPLFLKKILMKYKSAFKQSYNTSQEVCRDTKVYDSDLTWDEFNANVLQDIESYKGIFVQEETIDWNVPLYQRPQHIATAFGRLGYIVIYRTYNFTGKDEVNGFREIRPNVWLTNRAEVSTISSGVHSVYSTAYASALRVLENKNNQKLIYEYIDHIDEEISGDAENISKLIRAKDLAFAGNVDFIVASAKKLYDEAVQAVGKEKTIFVANGVDTDHYRNAKHLEYAVADDLVKFRGEYTHIIGYFGALAPWLWYEMINELSEKRPDLGFVYIGPDYHGGLAKLAKPKNVLYLGSIDYQVLPAYAHYFDVCFIPFKPGEIAKTTSPLKLFEYFALEKPVVVTSEMAECVVYPEVLHGNSTETISAALDKAILMKDDVEYKQSLAKLADENSWLERAKQMEAIFK